LPRQTAHACGRLPEGLFKRGRERLVAASCKRMLPLVGWQRAPADVVADVLLAHARERYWAYWPRGIGELVKEPSHVVVAGASATGIERTKG